ncbi:hypothetical protein FRC09_005828 [Ceratobasidium sp. 395]|nr:hypothetical protein FRC09_005828 [Ceratobasidium sp. 395]
MSLVVNRIFKTWRTGHSNKKAASENKRLQSGSTGYSHQSKTEGISRHRAISLISSDNPPFAAAPSISWSYCSYEYEESISLLAITLSNDDSPPENIEFNAVVFPSEASERLPRRAASLAPQASLTPRSLLTPPAYSALYAALTANTERFGQPYQYAIPPLPTNGLPRRLSSAAYDSASSVLPSPTWPTPPHTPSKLLTEPAPLLLPPPLSSAASPIRASPRANPRRLSNASARFSQRVSLASAYSLSRPPSSARLQSQQVSVRLATAPARKSAVSLVPADDILGEGDVVGDSVVLHNELVMAIDHGRDPLHGGPQNGAQARYEIVKKLGSGSYATVFLAREILAEPVPPNDTDLPFEWNGSDDVHADPDVTICTPGPSIAAAGRTYGRPFAIKCLSRASLTTPESLAVQMLEATLHRSLPVHPNVVSLHAALESLSCLFLVLVRKIRPVAVATYRRLPPTPPPSASYRR